VLNMKLARSPDSVRVIALNSVLFPQFGRPTMPQERPMVSKGAKRLAARGLERKASGRRSGGALRPDASSPACAIGLPANRESFLDDARRVGAGPPPPGAIVAALPPPCP